MCWVVLAEREAASPVFRMQGCGSPSSPRTRGRTRWRHAAHRGSGGPAAAHAGTTSASSRRSTPTSAAPRSCTAARARSRARSPEWLVPLGGTIGWASNGAVSNLAGTPVGDLDAAPRAARRRLRRRPPARARRPGDRLGRADELRRPAGRHVPLLLRDGAAAPRRPPAGRAPQAQPPRRADRGLRGRRMDRAALLRRPLPGRPQRRRAAGGRRPARPRAPARRAAAHRLRRPGRRAQGPAGAAARLRGAAQPACPPSS